MNTRMSFPLPFTYFRFFKTFVSLLSPEFLSMKIEANNLKSNSQDFSHFLFHCPKGQYFTHVIPSLQILVMCVSHSVF